MGDAVAEVTIVMAMLFLMFASAIAGFAVGRHTGGNGDKATVSSTQTGEQTVTTSGGSPAGTTTAATTAEAQTTTAAAGGGGGGSSTAEGKRIFASAGCAACHTLKAAGSSGTVGPNLDEAKPSLDKAVERVTNGKPPMPSFKGQLTDAQIQAVARFVSESTRGSG
jgi:sulfite dehydrogenase